MQKRGAFLPRAQIESYLDVETREWTVNEAVLEEVGNDLQTIIDCSDKDDTLLLDILEIRLNNRLVISLPLAINGSTENAESDAKRSRSISAKTIFRCPENQGSFLLR